MLGFPARMMRMVCIGKSTIRVLLMESDPSIKIDIYSEELKDCTVILARSLMKNFPLILVELYNSRPSGLGRVSIYGLSLHTQGLTYTLLESRTNIVHAAEATKCFRPTNGKLPIRTITRIPELRVVRAWKAVGKDACSIYIYI